MNLKDEAVEKDLLLARYVFRIIRFKNTGPLLVYKTARVMLDPEKLLDSHIHLDRVQGVDSEYTKIRSLIPGVKGEGHEGLKKKFPKSNLATGYHPMMAQENCNFERLRWLLESGNYSAVGECGLDRRWKNFEAQNTLFEQQITLAKDFDLPMIIHCVGYLNKLIDLVKRYSFKGVIHYYAFGSLPEIFLNNGLYFGFCAKLPDQSRARKLFEIIPIEKILIETDIDENGSANLKTLEKAYHDLAKIKKMDLSELISIISDNFEAMIQG